MNPTSSWDATSSDSLPSGKPGLPANVANVIEAALQSWAQVGVQHAIPVTGQSMWPTLRDGDRVWIAHGAAQVRRGDVIVYRREGGLVVHRVVSAHLPAERKPFITQGDNSRHSDAPVTASQVMGRVIAVERGGNTRPVSKGKWRWLQWGLAWCMARCAARVRALGRKFR